MVFFGCPTHPSWPCQGAKVPKKVLRWPRIDPRGAAAEIFQREFEKQIATRTSWRRDDKSHFTSFKHLEQRYHMISNPNLGINFRLVCSASNIIMDFISDLNMCKNAIYWGHGSRVWVKSLGNGAFVVFPLLLGCMMISPLFVYSSYYIQLWWVWLWGPKFSQIVAMDHGSKPFKSPLPS